MKNNKKVFSEEFKKNAVNLSTNSEKSLGEIANDLGIGFSTLSKWRSDCSPNNVSQSEILKKATAFFVNENY
jgi:transposase-like protein